MMFYAICRLAAWCVLRVGWGLRSTGVERVPATGGLLIIANHESYLDPPSVGGVITQRHLDYMARGGLFRFRPLGWLIGALNSIPIHEEAGNAGAIREVLKRLELGRAVLVFPEGSRSPDGSMQEFKRGVALLVKKSRCPVLPAAVVGAYRAWPRARLFPRPWSSRIRVRFGEAIPHDELLEQGADAALERLRREVERLMAEELRAKSASARAGA